MPETLPDLAALERAVNRAREHTPGARAHIDALNELSWAHRLSDRARGTELAREAEQFADAAGYRRGLGYARRNLAFNQMLKPELDETLRLVRSAIDCFVAEGDRRGEASASDLLATICEVVGDYTTALEHAQHALALSRALGDERGTGWALSSIGGILQESGDLEGAERRLLEGLKLFNELDYPIGQGRLGNRLSKLCLRSGRLDDAYRYQEVALERARASGTPFAIGTALAQMGEISAARGDLAEAIRLFREAFDALPTDAQQTIGQESRMGLGRALLAQGQLSDAREVLTVVLRAAEARSVLPYLVKVRQALADLEHRAGNYRAACDHLRAHVELRDQLLDAETRSAIKRAEVRAEVGAARKDAEIHRLKYVELKAMQSKLVESEKLAVLGNLAAGVVHEINSPLGALRSSADLTERALKRLEREPLDPATVAKVVPAVRGGVQTIQAAANRIAELVSSLRRFAEVEERQGDKLLDLNEAVHNAVTAVNSGRPSSVRVVSKLGTLPRLEGNPAELSQAVLALLQNSVKAMGEAGTVIISAEVESDHVRLSVSDDGPGIAKEKLPHLFDVQFGGREDRMRLQLGLALVASVVGRHGGEVLVDSTVGEGTTFTLKLPLPAER